MQQNILRPICTTKRMLMTDHDNTPGPDPDRLKIDMDFESAIKKAVRVDKPKDDEKADERDERKEKGQPKD